MNLKSRLLYTPEGMNPPNDLRDCCTFITHRVFVGRGLWNTDDAHGRPTSFTNLKAEYLRQFAPNYRKALDWLLANDYLQTDRKYVIGKKSIGYRIPAHCNIIRTPASTAMSCLINQEARQTYKHYTKAHKHLISWLPKFKLDTEGAKKHVAQLNREDGSSILTNEEFRDSVLCTVRLINDGEWACKVCHYGRFHSPYTRFLKELRGFVSYAGSSLVNIDICNSQPLMLTLLFPQSPLKNPKGSVAPLPIPTDSYTMHRSPSKTNASDAFTEANDTISKCPENDMKQYQELCESGGFYGQLYT